MKILKYLLFLILGLIAVVLIAAIFVKKEYHFEKSTEISASKDVVWDYVSKFENHKKFSQWKVIDPKMNEVITGVDGTVGAKMSWTSDHSDVGNGSQTITNIIPGERIDFQLDFDGKGNPTAFYSLTGDSTSCKVTWGLDMKMGYPFNFMGLFVGGMMDEMFDTGLKMLKDAAEQKK